jgi:hypothetical protein
MDVSSLMLVAFGAASLGFAFLHYRLARNSRIANGRIE